MKSKLSVFQFRNRIKENTKIGSPKFKSSVFGFFTIFDRSSETFYGLIDDSNFRLTTNTTIYPNYHILSGKYKNANGELYIDYKIEPISKFRSIGMKYFLLAILLAFNIHFFLIEKNAPILVGIAFNLFGAAIILFSSWDIRRRKKKLEKAFIEIFEIVQ